MYPSMQSFGYGLAAVLFCVAMGFVCHKVKTLVYRAVGRRKPRAEDGGKDRPKGR